MILSAHQPCYLPHAGLFAKIALADKFCVFDCVPFSRHDYTNRVQIKTHQGVHWLTVPTEHGQPLLKDARIASGGWARKHCRAIELAYSKAPYFDLYMPQLREVIMEPYAKLASLNAACMEFLMLALGLITPIVKASDYDFRGEKSALVLDMAKQLGAATYIFGSQGHNYADVDAFARAGIKVEFQDYQCNPYPQLHGGPFVPGLSVVDLLFNCGPDSLKILMDGND